MANAQKMFSDIDRLASMPEQCLCIACYTARLQYCELMKDYLTALCVYHDRQFDYLEYGKTMSEDGKTMTLRVSGDLLFLRYKSLLESYDALLRAFARTISACANDAVDIERPILPLWPQF